MSKPVKCPICGKECKHQGGLNLHLVKAHGEKKEKTDKQSDHAECCTDNMRLLNPHNQAEARAMQDGYTEVCTKCQTLQ